MTIMAYGLVDPVFDLTQGDRVGCEPAAETGDLSGPLSYSLPLLNTECKKNMHTAWRWLGLCVVWMHTSAVAKLFTCWCAGGGCVCVCDCVCECVGGCVWCVCV